MLCAIALIATSPAAQADSLLGIGIGRDQAQTPAGVDAGEQTVYNAHIGIGSDHGIGLDLSYTDLGELQRPGLGTFGAHAYSIGLSYNFQFTRRVGALIGAGGYQSGSAFGEDQHGYYEAGLRYWLNRDVVLTASYRRMDDLLGERHDVSMLSISWAL